MQQAFLVIISVLAAIYSAWTKQGKMALGFLILAIASVLIIPGLVGGIWVNVFAAASLIIYLVGAAVIVWKKKELTTVEPPENKPPEVKDEK